MSEQEIFTLTAACFGFVSALFFGVGSAFLSQSKLVAQSKTYYGANPAFAEALVSQSTQYAIGALLLVVAFVLQVLAVPASQAIHQWKCLVLSSSWLLVPSILSIVGLISYLACHYLTKWRLRKVMAELTRKNT